MSVDIKEVKMTYLPPTTVWGMGINDRKHPTYEVVDGKKKPTKEYKLWTAMLQRVGDEKFSKGSYIGCGISEYFKVFSNFHSWCQNQIGFNTIDDKGKVWQLDKDILSSGDGKVYSEYNCVFVPYEINMFLVSRTALRGKYPQGVCFHSVSKRYVAQIGSLGNKGQPITLGTFKTSEEAFNCYKKVKEVRAKDLAIKWRGRVDDRVINVLLDYTVPVFE